MWILIHRLFCSELFQMKMCKSVHFYIENWLISKFQPTFKENNGYFLYFYHVNNYHTYWLLKSGISVLTNALSSMLSVNGILHHNQKWILAATQTPSPSLIVNWIFHCKLRSNFRDNSVSHLRNMSWLLNIASNICKLLCVMLSFYNHTKFQEKLLAQTLMYVNLAEEQPIFAINQ